MSASPSGMDGGPPAKAPRVEATAASANDLLAAIQALGSQLSTLSVKVESLERNAASGASAGRAQPPPYPSEVTAEALTQLASDPGTPGMVAPFLSTLAALLPSMVDDHHLGLVQQCYTHALQLRPPPPGLPGHPPPTGTPPPFYPASPQVYPALSPLPPQPRAAPLSYLPPGSPMPPGALLPVRGNVRFVEYFGRMYYWASQGYMHDVSLPPRHPCKVCQALH